MGNKDLAAGTDEKITDELLSPCASRYRCLEKEANDTPGAVRRLSRLGQLDGLTVFGCFEHTRKEGGPIGVCKECHKCLEKKELPQRALINDTWQGKIPEIMRLQSETETDGLTPTEAAMLSINLCISELTVLPSGLSFSKFL